MHCHLIVSRKDQSNKKKLSPLTNHKNTKKGTVTGGFDRVRLFQQAEQGFDKLFGYNRQQNESFDYHNTMKNGSIPKQLNSQEQEFLSSERRIKINKDNNQGGLFSINHENKGIVPITSIQENNLIENTSFYKENDHRFNPSISFSPSKAESTDNLEEQVLPLKKRKKKKRKL